MCTCVYATLKNNLSRLPRIYPALPEHAPPPLDMRPVQNLTFSPEYTPLPHHYMRHSHNLPLAPRIYTLNIHMRLWSTPGINPFLPK